MNLVTFLIFSVSVLLIQDAMSAVLNDVVVPNMILIDNESENDLDKIVLDCDYDLKEDNKFLVLKWLKNDEAVYQWIRGQSPSVFPQFKGEIDDHFEKSPDPNQQYRALVLLHPTINSTGTYKCVIQTENVTLSKEKLLQVVDIRNYTINVYHHRNLNETHLECTIENVYPEPLLNLRTDDDDDIQVISTTINQNDNGLFNATTIFAVSDVDDDTNSYTCLVAFEGLQLNLTATAISGQGIILINYVLLFTFSITTISLQLL